MAIPCYLRSWDFAWNTHGSNPKYFSLHYWARHKQRTCFDQYRILERHSENFLFPVFQTKSTHYKRNNCFHIALSDYQYQPPTKSCNRISLNRKHCLIFTSIFTASKKNKIWNELQSSPERLTHLLFDTKVT